jgi:glycosyltransferase involved in cell wall biosynthesis
MKVVIALEARFERTPDGAIWTLVGFAYSFWKRYLEVFDRVCVVARVRDVSHVPSDWQRVDGEGVSCFPIPYYIGPWQYLFKAWQVQQAAQSSVGHRDAVILRVGGMIASCIQPMLVQTDHPYAVEVVADPYDVFAPGSIKSPLRPFFRWYSPRQLRYQCREALAAAYVTQDALQKRYPCPNFSIGVSDVELGEETFVSQPRYYQEKMAPLTLIFVGTMAQLYKAPDVLIDAVAVCVREGLNIQLILIGNGQYRGELEAQAQILGIGERAIFLGQLQAGEAVRAQLDRAELFVLPSHQEGLPRAMVEAMARALPCIGSTVGGIPELLPAEDIVPPGDVVALATKIREVVTNPERMARMSARNLEKAHNYQDNVLREKRNAFYRYVRERTEKWLKQPQL